MIGIQNWKSAALNRDNRAKANFKGLKTLKVAVAPSNNEMNSF